MLPLRAAHLWQMLLNALFTSHLVRLIIGGRGKGHYFSLSLRGAQRLLSFSPLSPPPPCNAPKKFFAIFFFFKDLLAALLYHSPCARIPRGGRIRSCTPFQRSSTPSRVLSIQSATLSQIFQMLQSHGTPERPRLPRPRCSLDAPSPLSGRESRGSAAQPGRHKPAYSQRASAQMKFQRGACLGPRIFPGRVPAGYRQALHPGSPKPADTGRYILGDNRIFQGAIQLISQCLDACQMLVQGALCRATAKGDQHHSLQNLPEWVCRSCCLLLLCVTLHQESHGAFQMGAAESLVLPEVALKFRDNLSGIFFSSL